MQLTDRQAFYLLLDHIQLAKGLSSPHFKKPMPLTTALIFQGLLAADLSNLQVAVAFGKDWLLRNITLKTLDEAAGLIHHLLGWRDNGTGTILRPAHPRGVHFEGFLPQLKRTAALGGLDNLPCAELDHMQKAFSEASNHGDQASMRILLERSPGIDINAGHGLALRNAAARGDLSTVEFLVRNRADVNTGDGHILLTGIREGRPDIVLRLLQLGADALHEPTATSQTKAPLVEAVIQGSTEKIEQLLRFMDPSKPITRKHQWLALQRAVGNHAARIVEVLVGRCPYSQGELDEALIGAVRCHDTPSASALLKGGASPRVRVRNPHFVGTLSLEDFIHFYCLQDELSKLMAQNRRDATPSGWDIPLAPALHWLIGCIRKLVSNPRYFAIKEE